MATTRTTIRSTKGKKLYAIRNEDGTFKDIQTYQRAHAADLKKKSGVEKETAKKAIAKKVGKKSVVKKGGVKNYEVTITLKFSTDKELKEFFELLGKQIKIPKNQIFKS